MHICHMPQRAAGSVKLPSLYTFPFSTLYTFASLTLPLHVVHQAGTTMHQIV